jgi:hypothetical protein
MVVEQLEKDIKDAEKCLNDKPEEKRS